MINAQFLNASHDFQGFIGRVKAKRDEQLAVMRFAVDEDMYRAQGAYNALDDVVNLIAQIDAEQRAEIEDPD